jgi:hypothetical protein
MHVVIGIRTEDKEPCVIYGGDSPRLTIEAHDQYEYFLDVEVYQDTRGFSVEKVTIDHKFSVASLPFVGDEEAVIQVPFEPESQHNLQDLEGDPYEHDDDEDDDCGCCSCGHHCGLEDDDEDDGWD